jgi:hypothetical protein
MATLHVIEELPGFHDDPLIGKYLLRLGKLVMESLTCPKDLRSELLPEIEARKAQIHRQIKGRRIQLLKSTTLNNC